MTAQHTSYYKISSTSEQTLSISVIHRQTVTKQDCGAGHSVLWSAESIT